MLFFPTLSVNLAPRLWAIGRYVLGELRPPNPLPRGFKPLDPPNFLLRLLSLPALALACAASALFLASASAQTPVPRPSPSPQEIRVWAQEILRLRAEVERLTSQIQIERAQQIYDLRSLEGRKSQLQSLLDQETLRTASLRDRLGRLRSLASVAEAKKADLRGLWLQASKALLSAIEDSLPFRKEERLRSVHDLQARIDGRRLSPEQGLALLWRIAEDEMRLSVLVERVTLPFRLRPQDPLRLLPVVRLGLFALFVRETPTRYGRLLRGTKGRFVYRLLPAKDIPPVRSLFENLERQIREGLYRLPLAPPKETDR